LHWDFATRRSTTRSTVTAVGGSVLVEEFLIAALDQRCLLVLDAIAVADISLLRAEPSSRITSDAT